MIRVTIEHRRATFGRQLTGSRFMSSPTLSAALACLILPASMGVAPDRDFLETDPLASEAVSIEAARLVDVLWEVGNAFGIVINDEVPWSGKEPRFFMESPVEIDKGQSLSSVLDDLVERTGGAYTYDNAEGFLRFYPAAGPETSLDLKVSIEVRDVTPWQALRALMDAVNGHPEQKSFLEVSLPCLEGVRQPPSCFTNEANISLSVAEVTARNALAKILAAFSFPVGYEYQWEAPHDQLALHLK